MENFTCILIGKYVMNSEINHLISCNVFDSIKSKFKVFIAVL